MIIDTKSAKDAARLTFSRKYFHPRHAAFLTAFAPLYAAVQSIDTAGRWLDERLYPDFEDTEIGEPIYIMASPRSGTTLLHRLMSLDEQFTYYTLWQTLFPTLTAYRAVDAIAHVDNLLGGPIDKLQAALARYWFRGWEGIHETRFNHAEEDEGNFFLQFGTPTVWLAFPYVHELNRMRYIDEIDTRPQFARALRGTMKRHLWHARRGGVQKDLLLKNVFLANRLGVVTDAAPRSRFVNIVRHPYRTIGSLMSFFTVPWRYHSPHITKDGDEAQVFADLAMDYALRIHHFMQELPAERGVTIMYTDLIEDPEREILKIYDQFQLEPADGFKKRLHKAVAQHRKYCSSHSYTLEDFGLSEDIVYNRLQEIFEAHNLPRHPDDNAVI